MSGTFRTTEGSDLLDLGKFLVRIYRSEAADFHFAPPTLKWKYLDPRSDWPGGRSYLLEKDGRIVAHAGILPVTFHLPGGQFVKSLTIMDWAADPAVPLAGITLFRKLMGMAPTCFIVGGAPVTRKILPRLGFRSPGTALTHAAWLRPWREFRSRRLTGRSALRLVHGWTHPVPACSRHSKEWEIVPVSQFEDSLRPMLSKKGRSWASCVRNIAELNHLLKCPLLEMRGFLLRHESCMGGYCITAQSDWEARVIDFLIDSEDANDWKHAIAAMTKAVRRDDRACRIRVLSSVPVMAEALEWNGYWRQNQEPIALYDPKNFFEPHIPMGFQYFDGDLGY